MFVINLKELLCNKAFNVYDNMTLKIESLLFKYLDLFIMLRGSFTKVSLTYAEHYTAVLFS